MLAFAGGMSAIGAVLRTIRAVAGLFRSINGGIVRLLSRIADSDTDQVNEVVVLKLTNIPHEIEKLGPPLLTRCLVIAQRGWPIEQGELCLGIG